MATNKIESLDPALIRPGRIDRKIEFPLPDIKTKRRIFGIHTVRKRERYIDEGKEKLTENRNLFMPFMFFSCALRCHLPDCGHLSAHGNRRDRMPLKGAKVS